MRKQGRKQRTRREEKGVGLQRWARKKGMEQRTRPKGMRWAVGGEAEREQRTKREGRRAAKKKRRKQQVRGGKMARLQKRAREKGGNRT